MKNLASAVLRITFAVQLAVACLDGGSKYTDANAQDAQTKTALVDTRIPIERRDPRYRQLNAIGIFVENDKEVGSGFLVDSCHVLTNAHVVFKEFSFEIRDPASLHLPDHKTMQFRVGASDLTPAGFEHVINGVVVDHGTPNGFREGSQRDWAVIRLDESLPSSFARLPLKQLRSDRNDIDPYENLPVIAAGYPADHTARGTNFQYLYADVNCKIFAHSLRDYLINTCQITGGDSGGPLIKIDDRGEMSAVGMVTGTAPDATGFEKKEDFDNAPVAVGFAPGTSTFTSVGDKILKAINSTPCDPSPFKE